MPHQDAAQPQTALGVNHLSTGKIAQARQAGIGGRIGAAVDDGCDIDALRPQIKRCAQPVIIVGENCHALAGRHGPTIDIGAQTAGQHDAGAVIIFKRNGAFNRTRAHQRAF